MVLTSCHEIKTNLDLTTEREPSARSTSPVNTNKAAPAAQGLASPSPTAFYTVPDTRVHAWRSSVTPSTSEKPPSIRSMSPIATPALPQESALAPFDGLAKPVPSAIRSQHSNATNNAANKATSPPGLMGATPARPQSEVHTERPVHDDLKEVSAPSQAREADLPPAEVLTGPAEIGTPSEPLPEDVKKTEATPQKRLSSARSQFGNDEAEVPELEADKPESVEGAAPAASPETVGSPKSPPLSESLNEPKPADGSKPQMWDVKVVADGGVWKRFHRLLRPATSVYETPAEPLSEFARGIADASTGSRSPAFEDARDVLHTPRAPHAADGTSVCAPVPEKVPDPASADVTSETNPQGDNEVQDPSSRTRSPVGEDCVHDEPVECQRKAESLARTQKEVESALPGSPASVHSSTPALGDGISVQASPDLGRAAEHMAQEEASGPEASPRQLSQHMKALYDLINPPSKEPPPEGTPASIGEIRGAPLRDGEEKVADAPQAPKPEAAGSEGAKSEPEDLPLSADEPHKEATPVDEAVKDENLTVAHQAEPEDVMRHLSHSDKDDRPQATILEAEVQSAVQEAHNPTGDASVLNPEADALKAEEVDAKAKANQAEAEAHAEVEAKAAADKAEADAKAVAAQAETDAKAVADKVEADAKAAEAAKKKKDAEDKLVKETHASVQAMGKALEAILQDMMSEKANKIKHDEELKAFDAARADTLNAHQQVTVELLQKEREAQTALIQSLADKVRH